MNIDEIIRMLSDSNLSDKEKLETICEHFRNHSSQPGQIIDWYRVLNTLKFELSELTKDADPGTERVTRRVINAISIELEILEHVIEHPELVPKDEIPKFSRKHWTASITGLVEIICVIKDNVNNGNVEIKEIANWFEYIFQVKLDNIYKIIEQIAERKKNKTKFLDEQRLNFAKYLEDFSLRKPRS